MPSRFQVRGGGGVVRWVNCILRDPANISSGGKAVVWQSVGRWFDHRPGCVDVYLSETPNPRLVLAS